MIYLIGQSSHGKDPVFHALAEVVFITPLIGQLTEKVIYTTKAIEAVQRQFRKLTKTKGGFPNENSLLKLLYDGSLLARSSMVIGKTPEYRENPAIFV